jgi:signal transduction histidine kinase/ActR/RegA family two-component response regulator
MRRVAKGLRAIAAGIEARWSARPAPPPGVAGLLDDDTALDEALARAEREGVVHLASPAITIETRAAWRARNRYGGGVTAWRIAGHVGYFRYFPSNHIAEEVGAVATCTAEEVWRAVLDTDLVVPWCFIHDLRGVRGIARSHRGMGLEAYRAIAPRLRGSAIVATPVQEPLARAFQLLLQRDVLRGCTVHRRAVDALRPHLTLDLGAAGVSPDEAQWINELYGATELTLDRGRHVVLAPPAWRWASGSFRLRLALIDGRIVVARYDGSVRAEDVPAIAARYDLVRGAVADGGAVHVCDTRGVSGITLATLRVTLREFTPARMGWMTASRHLVHPQIGPLLRMLDPIFPRTLDGVVASRTLREVLATTLAPRDDAPPDAAPDDATPYRAAIDQAIGVLTQLSTDADIDIAPPRAADAPVRDLFHALALVRDDVHALADSLRAANTGLEARIDARTADLARAKAEAETLAAEKLRLLSTMSHEVRTPLHGITANVSLLHHTRLDAEQSQIVRSLSVSAEHLRALVDDLLDWAQVDGEVHHLASAACDLRALAGDVIDALRGGAEARGIALRLEVDAALPAAVQGNAVRLRQVLFNLVGNAVKFTERGEVVVRVEAPARARVVVQVRDTGVGIAAEHLARIYEPFSPAARATAARFGGTGLGLAITRRIVTLHGGDIAVERAPTQGTLVTVTLPLRAVEGPHATPTPPPVAELDGLRVLLAEDNPTMQFVTARLLRRWRVTHTVVDDGAACVEALRAAPFDVVLMDLQMPVLDGFDATAQIRAHDEPAIRGVRVIALTADASPEARARALAVGADAVLTKPYRPEELFSALSPSRPSSPG